MKLDLGKKTRLLILGVGAIIVASTAWRYRNAPWIEHLLHVDGPAQVNIKFDNGSVRDVQPPARAAPTSSSRNDQNAVGKLKKCVRKYEVIYTDQPCPVDAKVAPVKGNVNVLGATMTKPESANSAEPGPKALRDALDLSGNNNLREQMMERVINR